MNNTAKSSPPVTWRRRALHVFFGMLLAYAAFLLLGFVPVNRDAALPERGVRVFIRSSDIHTDLVLPTREETTGRDWRELFLPEHFSGAVRDSSYVAIGWGNRRFFVETERWSDLKLNTALSAVLPSDTVLHVEYLGEVQPGEYYQEVHLSPAQYQRLVDFVHRSVGDVDEQGRGGLATDKSYHSYDRFYTARGTYHLFNNCNQWTGRALAHAGVPTGMWTPLTRQVTCWLPRTPQPE